MKRNEDESFEDYKERRKKWNLAVKLHKRGSIFYNPRKNLDAFGKPKPYRNPSKLPCCCLT